MCIYLRAFLLGPAPPAGVDAREVLAEPVSTAALRLPFPGALPSPFDLAPAAGFFFLSESSSSSFSTSERSVLQRRWISVGERLFMNCGVGKCQRLSLQERKENKSHPVEAERGELEDVALDELVDVGAAGAVLCELDEQEAVLVLRVALALGLVRVLDLEQLERVRDRGDLALHELVLPLVLAPTRLGHLDLLELPVPVLDLGVPEPEDVRVQIGRAHV